MTTDGSFEGWIDVRRVRAICYDESVYPEPHTYDPTRFLDKDGKIDQSVKAPEARIFGSGRRYELPRGVSSRLNTPLEYRICPGRHFAIRMLCLTVARILSVFDILPPVDNDGRPRIPEAKYQNTIVR
jgi:cytochrome P450